MYGYIYITTNLINGKKYIGQHKSPSFDKSYKGSGKIIKYAFEKYGWDNFKTEILEECTSEESLNQRERFWIKEYNATESPEFYNLSNGGAGFGGLSGDKNPAKREDVQQKMRGPRPSMMGKNNPNYGGLSEINIKHLKESRKRNKTFVGDKNPMYGKRGKANPNYGRVHVNNGIDYITIPQEDLDKYLSLGYVKTSNPGTKNYCYMNNGINSILILKEEASLYEADGWLRGKKNCPITHEFKRPSTIESIGNKKDITE